MSTARLCRDPRQERHGQASDRTLLCAQQDCAMTNGTDIKVKLHPACCCERTILYGATQLAAGTALRIDNPSVSPTAQFSASCVPTFFVTNLSDLDASYIHLCCTFTCFALPNPLLLTRHLVADASKCRFSLHTLPRSFAELVLPMRS